MLGLVVVNLVDGDGGVYDGRLNGLLLNDGLDGLRKELVLRKYAAGPRGHTYLVDVVVDMLACDHWGNRVGLAGGPLNAGVTELSRLLFETGLDGSRITMVVLTLLDGNDVVLVGFRENLTILDGLDGGMEVVLVHLTVDGGLNFLMTCLLDGLVHDGRGNPLVNGGVMVTRLVPKDGMMSVTVLRDDCIGLRARADGRWPTD